MSALILVAIVLVVLAAGTRIPALMERLGENIHRGGPGGPAAA